MIKVALKQEASLDRVRIIRRNYKRYASASTNSVASMDDNLHRIVYGVYERAMQHELRKNSTAFSYFIPCDMVNGGGCESSVSVE